MISTAIYRNNYNYVLFLFETVNFGVSAEKYQALDTSFGLYFAYAAELESSTGYI